MTVISIPKALREKLGEEATDAFVDVIKAIDLDSKKELATKADIARLEGKIDTVKSELDGKLDTLKSGLEGKIDTIKSDLDGELRLLKWMIGIMLAGITSLVLKAFFM